MDLYDRQGHRKYLTATERKAFLEAAGGFAIVVVVVLFILMAIAGFRE